MTTYLITGSSRGIGLEMVTQLLAHPVSEVALVFAASRSFPPELKKLLDANAPRAIHVQMDIAEEASIRKAAAEVERKLDGTALDTLINNAGITKFAPLEELDSESFDTVLHSNITAVHMTTQAFLPLLRRGSVRKVVNMTSTMGSIGMAKQVPPHPVAAYNVSKAGLNMLTAMYDRKYSEEGFNFVLISPGWLKTDLGSQHADLEVDVGVKATLEIIKNATIKTSGEFRNVFVEGWGAQYDGTNPPW